MWREVLLESSADVAWHELSLQDGRTGIEKTTTDRTGRAQESIAEASCGGVHEVGPDRFLVWRVRENALELRDVDLGRCSEHGTALKITFEEELSASAGIVCVDDGEFVCLWYLLGASGTLGRFHVPRPRGSALLLVSADIFEQLQTPFNVVSHSSEHFPALFLSRRSSWTVAAWDACRALVSCEKEQYFVQFDASIESSTHSGHSSVVRCRALSESGLFERVSGWLKWGAPEHGSVALHEDFNDDDDESNNAQDFLPHKPNVWENSLDVSAIHSDVERAESALLFLSFATDGELRLCSAKERRCLFALRLKKRADILQARVSVTSLNVFGMINIAVVLESAEHWMQSLIEAQIYFDEGQISATMKVLHMYTHDTENVTQRTLAMCAVSDSDVWSVDSTGHDLCVYGFPVELSAGPASDSCPSPVVSLNRADVRGVFDELYGAIDSPGLSPAIQEVARSDDELDEIFLDRIFAPAGSFDTDVLLIAVERFFKAGAFRHAFHNLLDGWSVDLRKENDRTNCWQESAADCAEDGPPAAAYERLLLEVVSLAQHSQDHFPSCRYWAWIDMCQAISHAWDVVHRPLALYCSQQRSSDKVVFVVRGNSLGVLRSVSDIESALAKSNTSMFLSNESLANANLTLALDAVLRLSTLARAVDPGVYASLDVELYRCETDANDLLHARAAALLRNSSSMPSKVAVSAAVLEICRMLRHITAADVCTVFDALCELLDPECVPPDASPFPSHRLNGHAPVHSTIPQALRQLTAGSYVQIVRARYELARDIAMLCCVLLRLRLQQPIPLWYNPRSDVQTSTEIQTRLESEILPRARELMKAYFAMSWLSGARTRSPSLPVTRLSFRIESEAGMTSLRKVSVPRAFLSAMLRTYDDIRFTWELSIGSFLNELISSFQDVAIVCEFLLCYHAISGELHESLRDRAADTAAKLTQNYATILAKHCGGGNLYATAPLSLFRGVASYRLPIASAATGTQETDFMSFFSLLCALDSLGLDQQRQHSIIDVFCCDVCALGRLAPDTPMLVGEYSPRLRYLLRLVVLYSDSARGKVDPRNGADSRERACINFAFAALHEAQASGPKREYGKLSATLWSVIFSQALSIGDFDTAFSATSAQPFESGTRRSDCLSQLLNVICEQSRLDLLCGGLPLAACPVPTDESSIRPVSIDEVASALEAKALASPLLVAPNFYNALFVLRSHVADFPAAASALFGEAVRLGQESELSLASRDETLVILKRQQRCVAGAIAALMLVPTASDRWIPIGFGVIVPYGTEKGGGKRPMSANADANSVEHNEKSATWTSVRATSLADLQRFHALLKTCIALVEDSKADFSPGISVLVNLLRTAHLSSKTVADAVRLLSDEGLHVVALDLLDTLNAALSASAGTSTTIEPKSRLSPIALDVAMVCSAVREATFQCVESNDPTTWRAIRCFVERYDSAATNYQLIECVADVLLQEWTDQAESSGQSENGQIQLPLWVTTSFAARSPSALARLFLRYNRLEDATFVLTSALEVAASPSRDFSQSTDVSVNLVDQILVALSWLTKDSRMRRHAELLDRLEQCAKRLESALSRYIEMHQG